MNISFSKLVVGTRYVIAISNITEYETVNKVAALAKHILVEEKGKETSAKKCCQMSDISKFNFLKD